MPKPNAMLARIEAAAKARYQARLHTSMDMLSFSWDRMLPLSLPM